MSRDFLSDSDDDAPIVKKHKGDEINFDDISGGEDNCSVTESVGGSEEKSDWINSCNRVKRHIAPENGAKATQWSFTLFRMLEDQDVEILRKANMNVAWVIHDDHVHGMLKCKGARFFKDVIKDAAAIFGDALQYFERTKKARGYATYMRLRATEYKTRVNDPDMCLPKAQKQVKVKKSLTTNLVFFYGDSGSGKTAYAKYFLRNLGYDNIDEIQWQPDREKFTYDKTDSATSARAIIIDEIPKERSIPIKYINVWHDPTTSKIPGMYCNVTNLAEYMIFISNQSPHEIWGKQEDFNQLQRRFGVAYKFEKVVKRGTQTSYCRPVYFSSGASIRGRPKEDITEFVRADVPKAYTDVLNIGCEIAQDDLQIEDGEDD